MSKITRKVCAAILSAAFFISATFSLSACSKKDKTENGVDGKTPFIGENGHWWIGETDTGVPARGAGSGDMLAGILLALLARGLDPAVAATSAVWLHSAAGDAAKLRLSENAMTPSDMIEELYRFI